MIKSTKFVLIVSVLLMFAGGGASILKTLGIGQFHPIALADETKREKAIEHPEIAPTRLAQVEEPPEPPLELFFGFDKNDLLRMAEILVMGIMAVLVILLVVRPMIRALFAVVQRNSAQLFLVGKKYTILMHDEGPGGAVLEEPDWEVKQEKGFLIKIYRGKEEKIVNTSSSLFVPASIQRK